MPTGEVWRPPSFFESFILGGTLPERRLWNGAGNHGCGWCLHGQLRAALCAGGCHVQAAVLERYVDALDALDGVQGNLFSGNGGPEGKGYTHDLVLRFPKGSRLYGKIPIPEEVHTGLDVEAGASWPLGLPAVGVEGEEAALSYLPLPERLSAGPADPGPVRFRLTCALCHYSLDVDQDGSTDLRSARMDQPTEGSPWRPEHSWGVGNQDLAIGWIVALSANPLLLAPVFSGPVPSESTDGKEAIQWVVWVRDQYEVQREPPETIIGPRPVALAS